MLNTILGTKLAMTQVYDSQGLLHPATQIKAGPCWITQINKINNRQTIQIGLGSRRRHPKPLTQHIKKAGLENSFQFLREIEAPESADQLQPGAQITPDQIFQSGDLITITGTAKGRGFTGVVKRHGFGGGPRTHGQSDRLRAPGSIGAGTTPGRVYKGKKMAGRSGGHQVTIKNLLVLSVDPQNHQITVKGAVPGHRHSLLTLKKTGHDDSFPGLTTNHPTQDSAEPDPQASTQPQESPSPDQGSSTQNPPKKIETI